MSSATYTFQWNHSKLNSLKSDVMGRMLNLGFKTAEVAQRGAPVLTSALITTIRATTDNKDTVYVLAGGSFEGKDVQYALKREFENNLHPEKRYYMRNAFDWLENNYIKAFEGLGK